MKPTSCRFTARDFRRDELENLVDVLEAYGININCEISESGKTAKLVFEDLPDKFDAKIKRTRGAGRRSQGINPPKGSIFNCDTTCREFMDWLNDGHTAEEAMEELGLTRATYFRRLKEIKNNVVWEAQNNPIRVKKGIDELHHTLGNVR